MWVSKLFPFFFSSDDDEIIQAQGEIIHGAEGTRRYVDRSRRRKDRLVKDLDSALNEENYARIQPSNAAVHTR